MKGTIKKAFIESGLVAGESSDPDMRLSILKRNAAMAELFITDEQDKAEIKKRKLGDDAPAEVVFSPGPGGQTVATVTISPTHEKYNLVISSIAEKCFQASTVIPVSQLQEELGRQQALKRQGAVRMTAMSMRNPSTKTGLAVTDEIRHQLRLQEAEKLRLADAKKDSEKLQLDRKLKSREAEKAAGDEVLHLHLSGSAAWEQLTSEMVKGAFKNLTNKELKDIPTSSNGLKKADVVAALRAHIVLNFPVVAGPAVQIQAPAMLFHCDTAPQLQGLPLQLPAEEAAQQTPLEAAPHGDLDRPRRGTKRPSKFD